MANPRDQIPNAVLDDLKRGDTLAAIKRLRGLSNLGLREAKQLVDAYRGSQPAAAARPRDANIQHAKTVIPHVHVTHGGRSGLSPGEVPRAGGAAGVVVLVAIGLLVAYFAMEL